MRRPSIKPELNQVSGISNLANKNSKMRLSSIMNASKMKSNLDDSANNSINKSINKRASRFNNFTSNMELKTKISHISEKSDFSFKEETDNKLDKLLDKIINAKNFESQGKSKPKANIPKPNLSIENLFVEDKMHNKVDMFINKMRNQNLSSPNEENDKFVLVEKNFIDDLRKENEEFEKTIKNLKDQNQDFSKTFLKSSGENNFLKFLGDNQEKLKVDNFKKIKVLNNEIKEANVNSKRLKNNLTKEKLSKDNILRALLNYTKNYNSKLAEELMDIYRSFNNQLFMASYKSTDDQLIENMMGKLQSIEKEIAEKDFELDNLNKIVVIDNTNTKIKKSKAP